MTKEKKKFLPLTPENICEIYNLLHSEGLISFQSTPESLRKVESLVLSINGSNFGIENYKTSEEKIVAHLFFLIKNHPFVDGNKRTAVLTFLVLCRLNNVDEHLVGYDLDSLAVFLESVSGDDYQEKIRIIAKALF